MGSLELPDIDIVAINDPFIETKYAVSLFPDSFEPSEDFHGNKVMVDTPIALALRNAVCYFEQRY